MFINVTSSAGLVTFPFASLYHATKFGLQGWSEGMSYELVAFGIRIKTVAPGFIKTEFGGNAIITSSEPYQELMDCYLKNLAKPELAQGGSTPGDIANVVYEAVTDGKDRIHYLAGTDVKSLYARRLEIGAEAAVKEVGQLFLS